MDFSKFDKQFDLAALKKDTEEASKNSGNFESVPFGKYEVSVNKMELAESKKGDPMVVIWFKVVSGEYANRLIFYNQLITQGFQIHLMNNFLKSLGTGIDIKFESFSQNNQLLLDIAEKIDADAVEFGLEYGETSKGFSTFKITDIFECEI